MISVSALLPFIFLDLDALLASQGAATSGPGAGVDSGSTSGPGPDSGTPDPGPVEGSNSGDPEIPLAWVEEAVLASGYPASNLTDLASHILSSFRLVSSMTVSNARTAVGLGVAFYCGASPAMLFFSDAEFDAFLVSMATHGVVPAPDQA